MKKKKPLGPLHGVPVAVKDVCYTKGIRTTAATKVLANYVPDFDATVVSRLKQAGAVILGKLNLCEGAMMAYSREFEVPVNPWNENAWPGGSSSGSGIAAAAGLAYGTIGTDTGGSIRYPAAYCGVVGLKPSWGRVSRHGVVPLALSLDHVGPIARRTVDCAIILDAISGYDRNDTTTSLGRSDLISVIDKGVAGIKLGWDEEFATSGVDASLARQLESAKELLRQRGVKVVDVKMPDLRAYGKDWVTICCVEAFHAHRKHFPERKHEYGVGFREWLERGSKTPASEYAASTHRKLECNGKIAQALRDVDALLCPVDVGQVFKVNREQQYGKYAQAAFDGEWARYTAVFNFNGAPSLTIPCGLDTDGLPLAMQLVGKAGREDLICRLGHTFEKDSQLRLHPPI